jgi:hypothetical protein
MSRVTNEFVFNPSVEFCQAEKGRVTVLRFCM